ncbi:nucleoside diphosphate kinase regulator [Lysobacter pythonis]|uniref:Nucleoside diphosphate kinase regulator n=1 Tax=Solilutibacter pythonis TaxID=2483112 RepID=A0A3M2HW30_9GAMM|nr:nucleoside diphosphate kinase regulator [Lysobacter pythonis]RMH91112.1 nucleoside diphosphate kinase regulator [Lysobacter pythonis]
MNAARPPLTLSRLDVERIETLLEKVKPGQHDVSSLQAELERANIVEPRQMPADVVTMNSTVVLRNETSGDEREITLVYPHEADGGGQKVSILAPVGSALLGLRVGDRIDWPMPGGQSASLRVLSIRFQPEAAGQFHR